MAFIVNLQHGINYCIDIINFFLEYKEIGKEIDLYRQELKNFMQLYYSEIEYKESPILHEKYNDYVGEIKSIAPKYYQILDVLEGLKINESPVKKHCSKLKCL